jgi:hypothetical protein
MDKKQKHIEFFIEDHDLWLRFRKMVLDKGESITSYMLKVIAAKVEEHEKELFD